MQKKEGHKESHKIQKVDRLFATLNEITVDNVNK